MRAVLPRLLNLTGTWHQISSLLYSSVGPCEYSPPKLSQGPTCQLAWKSRQTFSNPPTVLGLVSLGCSRILITFVCVWLIKSCWVCKVICITSFKINMCSVKFVTIQETCRNHNKRYNYFLSTLMQNFFIVKRDDCTFLVM